MRQKLKFYSLKEMIDSDEYQMYESSTLLNPQYHMINNTYGIDVDVMLEHNEEGMFGVCHDHFIQCWKEFIQDHNHAISTVCRGILEAEILDCERHHIENGTINDMI